MPRTSRARRRYTPEQRAARAEQDQQLNGEARADLADPQVIRRRIADLLTGRTPARLLTYSLRNQLLILRQAEQRGITLTDIDTRVGWNRRGRLIAAGQQGLRIARPVGAEDDDSGQATDPDADQPDTDPGTNRSRPRFRMSPRWDISQTVPMDQPPDADVHSDEEAACPGCDTGPGEPASRAAPAPAAPARPPPAREPRPICCGTACKSRSPAPGTGSAGPHRSPRWPARPYAPTTTPAPCTWPSTPRPPTTTRSRPWRWHSARSSPEPRKTATAAPSQPSRRSDRTTPAGRDGNPSRPERPNHRTRRRPPRRSHRQPR